MIEEVKKYTNEEGKGVTAYIPLSKYDSEGEPMQNTKTRYDGTVGIKTPMGIQPIHFPFPDDFTLEQCFEKFEEIADVEIQKIMQEAKKQQEEENLIVTPDQMKGGQTIDFPGS
jgi:hypothetical protein